MQNPNDVKAQQGGREIHIRVKLDKRADSLTRTLTAAVYTCHKYDGGRNCFDSTLPLAVKAT